MQLTEKLTSYDPAEDLSSDEAVAVFMAEALQTSDAGHIAHALSVAARTVDLWRLHLRLH